MTIVENDACDVDAVQFVAGCSFGKGNLLFRDYGEPVMETRLREVGGRLLYIPCARGGQPAEGPREGDAMPGTDRRDG